MASVPSNFNFVAVKLKTEVNNDVDERLVNALNNIIRPGIPLKYSIRSITISSLTDSHTKSTQVNSRHNQKKAVDISRINDKPVLNYKEDEEVQVLVDFIQTEFESIPGRRENFGPFFKKKSGAPHVVAGHADHIHLSVD